MVNTMGVGNCKRSSNYEEGNKMLQMVNNTQRGFIQVIDFLSGKTVLNNQYDVEGEGFHLPYEKFDGDIEMFQRIYSEERYMISVWKES